MSRLKSEMCKNYELSGQCYFGSSCIFAHSKEELVKRERDNNYKTKRCKNFFNKGYCNYGKRCLFSHKVFPRFSYFNLIILITI